MPPAVLSSAWTLLPYVGGDRRWTGGPISRAGSTSPGPHVAPGVAPGPILRSVVDALRNAKTPHLWGFREIAGEGFGLMGYVAALVEISAKTASVLGKRWAAQGACGVP